MQSQSNHIQNNSQIDYNHVLKILQDYMLTSKLITQTTKNLLDVEEKKKLMNHNSNLLELQEKRNDLIMDVIGIVKDNIQIPFIPKSVSPPTDDENMSLKIKDIESESKVFSDSKLDFCSSENKSKSIFQPKTDYYYPKQKDALYWCYFIIKNGFSAYEYPETSSFAFEKEEKFKSVELLRSKKQDLKTHKIKNIKEHVEDELINKEKIGMKTFIALCIASDINVLFIHKRKCFDLVCNMDLDAKIHIVICEDNLKCPSKYGVELDLHSEKVSYYRDNYFKWESVDKPLKAMGTYKSEELHILCTKIGMDFSKGQKTKKEMYEFLITNM
jgi:hypothetical protein